MKRNCLFIGFLLLRAVALLQAQPQQVATVSESSYFRALSETERKDYEKLKADWDKQTKGGSQSVKTFRATMTLEAQVILGRFGYGTLFTGTLDDKTREALRTYQLKNGLSVTLEVDAITYYALTKDDAAADKMVTVLPAFALNFYDSYVSADGVWDRMNETESSIQTSHLDCNRESRKCLEADAYLQQAFDSRGIFSQFREFQVTKWDKYEVVAEDATPDCERDQLLINQQEKSVTVISTPTYKYEGCKKSLGKPETVTYRLIDGSELWKSREAAAQKARAGLYQFSPEARAILDAKN